MKRYLRIYKELDITQIKEHLLVYGDLSANCANCQTIDLKLDTVRCPQCQTEFQYIAFRNIKHHLPKLQKITQQRPDVILVDFDDFQKTWGAFKAETFLK